MSALTDRIAAEHGHRRTKDGDWECKCGMPIRPSAPSNWMHKHLIAVTEAAVRERVARDIEYAESMSRASLIERPKIGPGEFLNDWQWAARIARGGAA